MNALRPRLERVRRIALPVVIFAAAAGALWFFHGRTPVQRWMLWPYVGFAAATLGWLISCVSVGHAALHALAIRVPFRERLLFDVAVGVLLFGLGLFVAGILRLLKPPFFVAYPAFLLLLGARWTFPYLRRAWRHLAAARRRAVLRPSLVPLAALVFGALGFTIVYLTIMIPDNVSFDARTYHLPIAEHYGAWGRIGRFPEGWYGGTLPHFASWLYTWPFTLRAVNLFGQVEIAAHMELALFVVTVFSIPLLVEALWRGPRARGTWAVFFLFPGLFLYDSSLGLAADHVLAFWAVPLALALRRLVRQPSNLGRAALVGLLMAGAALTKYQAVYILAPAGLLVMFVVVRELWRARREPAPHGRRWRSIFATRLAPPAVLVAAALVATAPHWLANLVWHGNPVYPLLRELIPSHPMVAGWPGPTLDTGWQPTGTTLQKLGETILATFTIGFVAHDWPPFHRDVPVFGFLFALSVPILLLARGARGARVLAGGTLLAIFIWYWTFHQDRYLQAILPWMVAATALALVHAWHAGIAARIAVTLMVLVQIAWGGDVPWIPGNAMMGHDVPALRTLRLFSSTYRGDFENRWEYNTGLGELDRSLPKNAVVVFHDEYLKLGINRRTIADSLRWQAGIDYRQVARADQVHDLFKSLDATHLVWNRSRASGREIPIAGQLVFYGYTLRYGEERRDVLGYGVVRLATKRPPARPPGAVLYAGCNGAHLVRLDELDALVEKRGAGRGAGGDAAAMLPGAEFAVVDTRCAQSVSAQLSASFVEAPAWGGDLMLWVRRN